MLSLTTIVVFATASLLLAITPGPDIIYVMTCGIGQGRRAALFAALGFSSGVIVHTTFAVVGLSAIIRSSALAFQIVKYVGAAYLIYLGIKALTSKNNFLLTEQGNAPSRAIFWQSVLANVLNPKVALFFLAFLPQFVNFSSGNVAHQPWTGIFRRSCTPPQAIAHPTRDRFCSVCARRPTCDRPIRSLPLTVSR